MQIYPAIDVCDGKAVRLKQGSFKDMTVFNDSVVSAADKWVESGASYIHLVDLDGARYGKTFVTGIIKEIKNKYPDLPIQTGGGVRQMGDIDERINSGADRVIIGTAAVKNPQLVKEAVIKYGGKIAVGIDAKDGMVAVSGWEEVSDISALDLCFRMKEIGIDTVIYTDISKDGMMCGPNIASSKELIDKTGMNIIVSGGISNMEDIENSEKINAAGVIIGKALYGGALELSKVIERFERK